MDNKATNQALDWGRTKRLMKLGLASALIAAIGDMVLGWGIYDERQSGLAYTLSLYQSVSDGRLLASELLGMFGMTLELLCLFAVYRLMAVGAPKLARAYRVGILGSAIFGVCGYHVAFVAMFFTYKQLCTLAGMEQALAFIARYAGYFVLPSVALYFIFLILLTVAQMMAFIKGGTPYPKWCWIFSIAQMSYLVYAVCEQIGNYPITNALSTAWLHLGAVWMYAGLLITARKAE